MTGRMETSKTSQYQTYFYVKWTTAQDSISNKTTVNWEIHLDTPRESWYTNAVRIDYLKINNTTVKSSQTYSNISHTDYTLASGSNSFSHNSNGDLTLSFSFSGWLYGDGTFTATYSQAQPQITVCTAATISFVTSQVAFGSNCAINVVQGTNNSKPNCTYKLTYSCNSQTGTVSSEKSTDYSFSTNNFNLIKNNISNVTCTLTLTTYWNNNSVGSSSKTFDIVIPSPASNFTVDQGEDTNYQFDKGYPYSFIDNSGGKYAYKLKIGTDDLINASRGSTLTVSSAQCVDAEFKNIDIYLYTYNGNAVFSNPQKVTELFYIPPDTDDNYKPTFVLSSSSPIYNDMPQNNSIFLNGSSRQSSIVLEGTFHGGKAGESNFCGINSISTDKDFINIQSWDGSQIIIYLTQGYEDTPIEFTITDTRGRNTFYIYKTGESPSETGLGDITVKNYIPLSIKDVKVYNEYTQGFKISYSLQSTDNDSADVSGSMVLGDNLTYSLVKDGNNSILVPQNGYPGSVLSKTITIIASLYGDELSYTLYLAPQEKALNLYNGNKVIRVGGMAKEVDLYILLTTKPSDWNNNYTYYYKKVNNEYVSVDSTDTWASNTYYQKRDKWGLVVGNFDLTITDTEIAILKNKFGM